MKLQRSLKTLLASTLFGLLVSPVQAIEWQGQVGFEGLKFFQNKTVDEQSNLYSSVLLEPEFFHSIDVSSEVRGKLFYRHDSQSSSRTHGDIRELMYYRYGDDWEIHAGIGKVFWGVTESRHLVDTINQIDNIEILDDEQRLGQPLFQAKLIRDWGTVDLFVLPYFREVDFADEDLRPYLGLEVTDPLYQDGAENHHIDFAARWSHYFGDLDIGLSYFRGTQRNPLFNTIMEDSQPVLQPVYVQTQQLGFDAQYIYTGWLFKFEGVHRSSHTYDVLRGKFEPYLSSALVTGFEYTFYGVANSAHDIGLIGEYLYDEWQDSTPFQRDWMTGVRWVWNDAPGTEWLLGNIYDLDDGTQIWQLEASRRLNESWKASMIGRWSTYVDDDNRYAKILKDEDQISVKLEYFF